MIGDLPSDRAENLAKARADATDASATGVVACPPQVGPTIEIEDPKTVVVPRDYVASIARYHLAPHRIAVRLGVDSSFDGTGTLSASSEGDRIRLFTKATGGDEQTLPLTLPAKKFNGGYTLYIQAVKASGGLESTVLKWELKGGSKAKKAPVTDKLTCIKLTLDLHKPRDPANPAADPVKLAEGPKHDPGRYIHVQEADPLPLGTGDPPPVPADRLPCERAQIVVKPVEPSAWQGTLVLMPCDLRGRAKETRLAIFDDEVAAKSQSAKATPLEIPHAPGFADKKYFLEGVGENKNMLNSPIKLAVKGLTDSSGTYAEGDRGMLTVLKVELELCKSRRKVKKNATDFPPPMTRDDKHQKGRFVHVQFAQHHGRAGVRIKPIKPEAFRGKLELGVWDPAADSKSTAKIELFDDEVPAAGHAAKANTFEVTVDAAFQKDGKCFWAQGKAVSGALRDAQVRVGVKDHINYCDSGRLTAVQFSELAVELPSTPEQTNRGINHPVATHTFDHAKPPADASYDHAFTAYDPLVLIEDSIPAADLAKLSVKIAPATAKEYVSWWANRDKRKAAPKGDHADIVSLKGNTKDPALVTQDGADELKATMNASAVGSFHIHPYIDQNGSNRFDFDNNKGERIDREPFLCLNLVLVRVEGVRNDSVAQPANASVVPPAPTSATGVRVNSGAWAPATSAAYSKATVKVIGGGEDGRRGLDQVFGGWGQHIGPTGTSASAPPGLDIFARYRNQGPVAPPALPPAPTFHQQFFIFTRSGPAGTTFGPGGAAPVVEAAPVLDVTPLGAGADGVGGDSCTGQWGGHGSKTPIAKNNKSIGQEWVVDTLDSPGVGLGATHPNFPAPPGGTSVLIEFRFSIDFRVDLLFWTNRGKVSTNSADPAPRLYSSVQTNNWAVRFAITFNHATGAPAAGVPRVATTMKKDPKPKRKATPVVGTGLETRFPTALDLFSVDATA